MASTLSSLIVVLGLDAADFQKGIKGAEKSAGGFAARMQKIGGAMQNIGKTMTIGLTLPIVAFGASSIKSAMDAESALADLEAVIASTGNATGITSDQFQKMAKDIQKTTKFSDEAVMAGETMLLQFDKLNKDIFPEALKLSADYATRMGVDFPAAAMVIGKALDDPAQGIGRLNTQLKLFSDAEMKAITDMAEAGNVAGAQAAIMDRLREKIGGAAEAAGATSAGGFEQFKNQLDDMKEIVGTSLIPVLTRLMETITPLIEKFSSATPETQNLVITLLAVAAAAGPIVTTVGGIVSAIGTLTPILTGLFTFITATAIPVIGAFIIANAAWIVPLLLVAATVYLVYLAFKNNFGGITTTVQQLWFIIKWAFGNIVNAIMEVIDAVTKMIASFLGVKLPEALTPGSPTPFEMGLRGIKSAMDAISSSSLPKLNMGLGITPSVTSIGNHGGAEGGAGSNITINIENPKGETSEESIKKTLQNLSYLGVVK